jgi:hypothetical protein
MLSGKVGTQVLLSEDDYTRLRPIDYAILLKNAAVQVAKTRVQAYRQALQ